MTNELAGKSGQLEALVAALEAAGKQGESE